MRNSARTQTCLAFSILSKVYLSIYQANMLYFAALGAISYFETPYLWCLERHPQQSYPRYCISKRHKRGIWSASLRPFSLHSCLLGSSSKFLLRTTPAKVTSLHDQSQTWLQTKIIQRAAGMGKHLCHVFFADSCLLNHSNSMLMLQGIFKDMYASTHTIHSGVHAHLRVYQSSSSPTRKPI